MKAQWTLGAGLLQCLVCLSAFGFKPAEAGESKVLIPHESELTLILGQPLATGFDKIDWKTGTPPFSNLIVYAVERPKYDVEFLKRLASALGVTGTPVRMPSDFLEAPGYWIKEPNPTNKLRFRSVSFSQVAGNIGFGNGEDNHRWDLKNHRPLAIGVPTASEALQKTLALLPILGISTNDLEHNPDGTLKWVSDNEGTTYTDREDQKRKRYIRQMNITLWQRMPAGGSTIGIGTGGALRVGFMSEGKLAELGFLFRRLKPLQAVKPKTKAEIISQLKRGQARTFYERVPKTITVTNCAVVYPQGNMICKQSHVWPVYFVRGFAVEDGQTNEVSVYVPIAW